LGEGPPIKPRAKIRPKSRTPWTLILVVLIVALLAIISYLVYQRHQDGVGQPSTKVISEQKSEIVLLKERIDKINDANDSKIKGINENYKKKLAEWTNLMKSPDVVKQPPAKPKSAAMGKSKPKAKCDTKPKTKSKAAAPQPQPSSLEDSVSKAASFNSAG